VFTSDNGDRRAIWRMSEYRRAIIPNFIARSTILTFRCGGISLVHVTGMWDPVKIFGGRLTTNISMCGVAYSGRNSAGEEESPEVALVTKDFWQNRFGGDRM